MLYVVYYLAKKQQQPLFVAPTTVQQARLAKFWAQLRLYSNAPAR